MLGGVWDFNSFALHALKHKAFNFTTFLWGLWNVRNKKGIEKEFPKTSEDVFYKTFFLLAEMENPLEEGGLKLNYLDDVLKFMKPWL